MDSGALGRLGLAFGLLATIAAAVWLDTQSGVAATVTVIALIAVISVQLTLLRRPITSPDGRKRYRD